MILKPGHTAGLEPARGYSPRGVRPATQGRLGLSLVARSSRGSGPRRGNGALTPGARGMVTACSSRVGWCGGVLTGASVAAGRWLGSSGEHQGAPWRAPAGGGNGGLTGETDRRAGAEWRRRGGGGTLMAAVALRRPTM
jgi:hypothetical protein